MLAGRYPSDEFAELRPRLVWDRLRNTLRARSSSKRLAIVNGGTIPDRGLYGVFLATGGESSARSAGATQKTGKRVGELDEEMVFELREGEVFLLGASSWRADTITSDRVLVTPAAGEPGKMPFWHGDRAGRTPAFGARIGALTRRIAKSKAGEAARMLKKEHRLDESAAMNLVSYVGDQVRAGAVPTDDTIVVERFVDEHRRSARLRALAVRLARARAVGDGDPREAPRRPPRRAGRGAGRTTASPFASRRATPIRRSSSSSRRPTRSSRSSPRRSSQSSLFAARFREASARALLLPRRAPGKRSPLWAQRKRASDLLAVASRYPSFPMVLEAYRECLRDVFDLPAPRGSPRARRDAPRSARPSSSRRRPRLSRPRCSFRSSRTSSTTATRRSPSAARTRSRSITRSSASSSARPSSASS